MCLSEKENHFLPLLGPIRAYVATPPELAAAVIIGMLPFQSQDRSIKRDRQSQLFQLQVYTVRGHADYITSAEV